MATINISPGINVITYRGDTPLNFSSITNFDTNITKVMSPDCKVRGGVVYQNFQSYFPGAGPLNDWLTYFAGISSYIVVAKTAFSFNEQGRNLTQSYYIKLTAPIGMVYIDSNRVNSIPVSNYDAYITNVYWFDQSISTWRKYTPGLGALNDLNGSGNNNWLPGRTYYVQGKPGPGSVSIVLDIPRIYDYLLADDDSFLLTDSDDNICVDS